MNKLLRDSDLMPVIPRRRRGTLGILAAFLPLVGVGCASPSADPGEVVGVAEQDLSTCVTLQRGALGTVTDTTIATNVSYVGWNGTAATMRAGGAYEALLKFDVSSLPAGATVTSATLSLTTTSLVSHAQLFARRALAPWTESTSSFAGFNQQVGPAIGSMTPSSPSTTQTLALEPATVQGWRDGSIANDGLALESMITGAANAYRWSEFVSSDAPTVAARPALTVCYEPLSACAADPCSNGVCVDVGDSYVCECAPGYTGANCETEIDECASDPCSNGVCVDLVDSYVCDCAPGYTGANCETEIDECASDPCLHGECIDLVDSYSCACAPGYTGANCETEIDECESDPCSNGVCVDLVDSYVCDCAPGYTGANCEDVIDNCSPNPCQNDGVCTNQVNAYTCACAPGFNGANCEASVCGDGIIAAGEACDDGNAVSGDGCSATCTVEPNVSCQGQPSVCGYASFVLNPGGAVIGYVAAGNAPAAPPPPLSGTAPLARVGAATATADACAALPAGSLAGKVALIRRGTCTFAVKAANAQAAGAIGVVFYNNVAGVLLPGLLNDASITIPLVGISASNGVMINSALAADPGVTMTWTAAFTPTY